MFSNRLGRYMAALGATLTLGLASAGYPSAEENMEDPYLAAAVAESPEGLPIEAPADPPEDPPEEAPVCTGELSFDERSMYRLSGGFCPVRNPVTKFDFQVGCKGFSMSTGFVLNNETERLNEAAFTGGYNSPIIETKYGEFSAGIKYTWLRLYEVGEEFDKDVDTIDLRLGYGLPDSGWVGHVRRFGPDSFVFKFTGRLDNERGEMYRVEASKSIPLGETNGFDIVLKPSVEVACMNGFFGVYECLSNTKYEASLSASNDHVTFGLSGAYHDGYGNREDGGFGNDFMGRVYIKVPFKIPLW
jgi:hypothetical protein